MKVLFAVNNESISESIVKLYQKEYREIISGKNVYYFNAIVKELQRDQTYDRVVISEDLEPYTNNNFDIIDKFLFEQLDKISDEAISGSGSDIPIIFIAADRRSKSDNLIAKLFSIGVYDALLGADRSIPEVCNLLNKPRTKKEAKLYYKIESEEVSYQAETEDSVSETEIQNILTHYKKLGKNTERYVDSFNNIAAQYNDAQLRIISKFLPLNVKAVLEAESTKYQSIMTFGEGTYKKPQAKDEKKNNLKIGFIETNSSKGRPTKPVVIPSAVNKDNVKKLARNPKKIEPVKQVIEPEYEEPEYEEPEYEEPEFKVPEYEEPKYEEPEFEMPEYEEKNKDDEFSNLFRDIDIDKELNEDDSSEEEQIAEPVKRGRGRPKKRVSEDDAKLKAEPVKRGRGRPKKQTIQEEPEVELDDIYDDEGNILSSYENEEENTLPGFDEIEENTLPGFDESEDSTLPGFEEDNEEDDVLPGFAQSNNSNNNYNNNNNNNNNRLNTNRPNKNYNEDVERSNNGYNPYFLGNQNNYRSNNEPQDNYIDNINSHADGSELARFLSRDKKVVAFVGTSKAGTSFLINNVADLLARSGINTAILDLTTNRNSYYIYTKNEETLRRRAQDCLESLEQDIVDGIEVSRNLTVFTSIPGKKIEVNNIEAVVEALVKKYSLVLMDCDFNTPNGYFELAQEIYLVQSMDILTIQPLTAFLRDLQTANSLQPDKLKVVINKSMKIRGLTPKAIIGGISCYNDPEMSYMRNLFDKDKIPAISISFDADVLARYLSGMVDCIVTTNGYSRQFMAELKELADMVYPLINSRIRTDYTRNNKFANNGEESRSSFSNSMNNTLERMKRQFK